MTSFLDSLPQQALPAASVSVGLGLTQAYLYQQPVQWLWTIGAGLSMFAESQFSWVFSKMPSALQARLGVDTFAAGVAGSVGLLGSLGLLNRASLSVSGAMMAAIGAVVGGASFLAVRALIDAADLKRASKKK